MSDAPKNIGILRNGFGLWAPATTDERDEVTLYTRSDLIPALLIQAREGGRAQGLREAQDAEWNDAIHAAIHAVRGLDFEYTEPVLLALRDLLRKESDK